MYTMLFNFLLFAGLFVMFFCILRGQDNLQKALHEELRETRAQLHALEIRVAVLSGEDLAAPQSAPVQAAVRPLDSLSMESDETPAPDKALELKF